MDLYNEWVIMREATKKNCTHIIHLNSADIGIDHAVIKMPKYETSFREYLWKARDFKELPTIFTHIAQGLKELHDLGYVHRDLKPENVMVSFRPLRAVLIDFNRAYPLTQSTKGTVRGTEGYFPEKDDLRDGSTKWDIWSLGAMILEANLDKNDYLRVNTQRGTIFKAEKHLREGKPSPALAAIINGTILLSDFNRMLTLD
jgi:serine/threonine protein kinase